MEEQGVPPTLKKVTITLEWDPPENPQFPPQMYVVSIDDAEGNKKNIPVDIGTTTYTIDVDLDKDVPQLAMVGVTYPIGPSAVTDKKVSYNILPKD